MLLDQVNLLDQSGESCPVGLYDLDAEWVLFPAELEVVLGYVLSCDFSQVCAGSFVDVPTHIP